MTKSIGRVLLALVIIVCATGCLKLTVPSSEICGTWRAIHEDWTVWDNGVKTNSSYDYGGEPTNESVFFKLSKPSFDLVFSTAETKSLRLVYSDRFSAINPSTSLHTTTEMSVTLKKRKLYGPNNEVWTVGVVQGNRMQISYNSGVMTQDGGGELQRIGSFILVKQ